MPLEHHGHLLTCTLACLMSIQLQEPNASILPIALTIGKKVIFLNRNWKNCINTVQWKSLLADHISLEKNLPPFIGKPLNLIRSALDNPLTKLAKYDTALLNNLSYRLSYISWRYLWTVWVTKITTWGLWLSKLKNHLFKHWGSGNYSL